MPGRVSCPVYSNLRTKGIQPHKNRPRLSLQTTEVGSWYVLRPFCFWSFSPRVLSNNKPSLEWQTSVLSCICNKFILICQIRKSCFRESLRDLINLQDEIHRRAPEFHPFVRSVSHGLRFTAHDSLFRPHFLLLTSSFAPLTSLQSAICNLKSAHFLLFTSHPTGSSPPSLLPSPFSRLTFHLFTSHFSLFTAFSPDSLLDILVKRKLMVRPFEIPAFKCPDAVTKGC